MQNSCSHACLSLPTLFSKVISLVLSYCFSVLFWGASPCHISEYFASFLYFNLFCSFIVSVLCSFLPISISLCSVPAFHGSVTHCSHFSLEFSGEVSPCDFPTSILSPRSIVLDKFLYAPNYSANVLNWPKIALPLVLSSVLSVSCIDV